MAARPLPTFRMQAPWIPTPPPLHGDQRLAITQADGQQWRMAMNNPPVLAVGTPEAFDAQLRAMAPERPPASRIRRGWPPSSKPIPSALARASHWALYALMLALPLTGWAMQGAAGLPVRVGGVVLPALVDADLARYGLLRELHAWLAYGLLALVLGHAGAALHHAWVRRDGVFEHMTLGRRRCD